MTMRRSLSSARSQRVIEPHQLDARTPLLFLPVYVETRFIDVNAVSSELWIRIFPDQISINSHEPELTKQEIEDGERYWDVVWDAIKSASLNAFRAPWRDLASRYGAPRAAWIARQLTPKNLPPAAGLTLTFGAGSITFTCSRYGAAGNQVQIAIDTTSLSEKPVVVNGDLVTVYANWDGTLHTTTEIARFYRSVQTDHGGAISAVARGTPQPVVATVVTNLKGGQDPSGAPSFPSPPLRDSSWEKPAIAAALPDRWAVVLISGTDKALVQSQNLVKPDLAMSLDPYAEGFPPGSPVDSGLQWLIDFDAALEAGMALKIPLTSQQRSSGFDQLIVYGLRSRDLSGSETLGGLFDAHHYTDGFALVPQGSPTNNTPDASSAYSRKDPDYAISFAVERDGALIEDPQNQPDADGNRFATLIGFDPLRMTNVQYSQCTGSRNGSDMVTVLWPSTLDYFLIQIMEPTFTIEQIQVARQYAIDNVIARGPIPAFRVGQTPYGVLPITSLRLYPTPQGMEGEWVNILRRSLTTWFGSSLSAPHMSMTGDPDTELMAVLGMDASSMAFDGRQVLGYGFLWNYMIFSGMAPKQAKEWLQEHRAAGKTLLDNLGVLSWDPRLLDLTVAGDSFPIPLPTVQAGSLSESDGLTCDADVGGPVKLNYIQWLQQASVDDLMNENYPGPQPSSLLYKLLRVSVVLEYGKLAAIDEIGHQKLTRSQLREAELIAMRNVTQPDDPIADSSELISIWSVLGRPSRPDPAVTWGEYLVHLRPASDSPFAELNGFRASLTNLASLPTAELDRLLTETLDICSHRLDSWATAIATANLKRTRANGNTGVHLACYGWVENLRPGTTRPQVTGQERAQAQMLDAQRAKIIRKPFAPSVPLQPLIDNGGFIYAPSQDQAAVAAILRSGYMTHKGLGDEAALSVDLSSERVRGALMLLDGVRQGQSLNALQGYLFESGLHDLKLEKYVQPFRDCFPMVANQVTASESSRAGVAASSVVDGLALRTAWESGKLPLGQDWNLCPGLPRADQSKDQNAIIALLQKIDGYADALGELSIAEAVFQTVRGNFERAGGLLAAVSKGQRPPDPEVLNTSHGGLDITHRVGLLFAGSPPRNAWTGVTLRARAMAEPWLDAWLSMLLPDPTTASVTCTVSYHDKKTGDQTLIIALAQLGLAPLDCIAMAEGSTNAAQRSELEYRILYAAGVPPTAEPNSITITFASSSDNTLSFPDLLYLWKTYRALINGARSLRPQDFSLPAKKVADSEAPLDMPGLLARANAALGKLQQDLKDLSDAAPGGSHPERLPDALMACSFYGLAGSVPLSNSPTDARLADQAKFVSSALKARFDKAASLINNNPAPSLSDLTRAFAEIFGKEFIVLPSFTPLDKQSVVAAFGQSDDLIATDKSALSRWLTQLSYVRPAITRLDMALSLADIVGQEKALLPIMQLAQLPLLDKDRKDRWLGLPWDPTNPPNNGRVALACFVQGHPTKDFPYAGLLIDEWVDKVPSAEEKAAVAFHYEEPKAAPPHALLLGVCPDNREFWDDEAVTAILQEALELTKIRTVDLHTLQQAKGTVHKGIIIFPAQVLPALYFPLNLQDATVSTDFARTQELRRAKTHH